MLFITVRYIIESLNQAIAMTYRFIKYCVIGMIMGPPGLEPGTY